jgi:hypothetical protein
MLTKIFHLFTAVLLISCSGKTNDPEANRGAIDDFTTFFQSFLSPKSNSKYDFVVENSCGFDYKLINQMVYSFDSDIEAEDALKRIMRLTGLPPNFKIRAASVSNACAVIQCDEVGNCDRYILYNQEFMERVKNQTNTSYAELAVLAHEIAHHMAGHTLTNNGSSYDMELEADKFAGFILYKLGASIEDSKLAYSHLSIEGSITHPPRDARIAALANGYFEAKRNGEGKVEEDRSKLAKDSNQPKEKQRTEQEGYSNRYWALWAYARYCDNNLDQNENEYAPFISRSVLFGQSPEDWPVEKNVSPSGKFLYDLRNVQYVLKASNDTYWTFNSRNKLIGGCDYYGYKTIPESILIDLKE